MDSRGFKECKVLTDNYKMMRFNEVAHEKYETKCVMLHIDLKYLPKNVLSFVMNSIIK